MQITAGVPARSRGASPTVVRFTIAIAAIGLLAWAAWWGYRHVMWWTPTGREIAQVVRGAAGVNEALLTPPQAYTNRPITRAEMLTLARAARKKLADYYTGVELTNWRTIATRTLNPKSIHDGKTDAWRVHWRIDWVRLGELTLFPGGATATAVVEAKSNGGIINRMNYTWQLVQTRVGWRIKHQGFAFQPGYGP